MLPSKEFKVDMTLNQNNIDTQANLVKVSNILNNTITCANIINIVTEVVKDTVGDTISQKLDNSMVTKEVISGIVSSQLAEKLSNK